MNHRRRLWLVVLLAAGCRHPQALPSVSYADEIMGAVLSVGAWGIDTSRLSRAVAAVFDSARAVDAGRHARSGTVGGTLGAIEGEVHAAAGPGEIESDALARGYALDRGALALGPAADSAVLTFATEFLFLAGRSRVTHGEQRYRLVGIHDPDDPFRALASLAVPDSPAVLAVATLAAEAGTAARARSVTAVAGDAAHAAGWASALLRMACDQAVATGSARRVGVVCVDGRGGTAGWRVLWTPDLAARVTMGSGGVVSGSAGSARGPAPAPAPGRGAIPRDSKRRSTIPGSSP